MLIADKVSDFCDNAQIKTYAFFKFIINSIEPYHVLMIFLNFAVRTNKEHNNSSNENKKISLKELLSQEKPLLEEKKNKEYKELLFKEQDVILEKKNSSLANLMLGLISLIIGGVLLFLSFKYDVTRTKVFNPKSFEFILSCIVLASCLYFLS